MPPWRLSQVITDKSFLSRELQWSESCVDMFPFRATVLVERRGLALSCESRQRISIASIPDNVSNVDMISAIKTYKRATVIEFQDVVNKAEGPIQDFGN